MGAVNLGTWRIAIIVALVVVGVAVLANGFDADTGAIATPTPSATAEPDEGDGTGATDTQSPSPQEEEVEETPAPNESGVPVKVFNGTSVPGLAALVQDELVAAGYEAPEDPANAPAAPVAKTVVYFRGGPEAAQNEADATFLAESFIEPVLGKMPEVDELSSVFDDVVGRSITIVVQVGDDYAANLETAEG
jgi:hypothetical protein